MPKMRISTILLSLGLVVALLAAVNFFLGQTQEHEKRVFLETQLQKMKDKNDELTKERDELLQAKGELETQLTDEKTKAQGLADGLAQEKRAHETLNGEVTRIQKESADTKSRLDAERKEKLTVTEELAKAKQSYQALSNELTTLRQAKEALEKRVKEMLVAQASETERIVVKPPTGATSGTTATTTTTASASTARTAATATPAASSKTSAAAPVAAAPMAGKEGKVLVVNREFNFVVANLGSKDGIKNGTKYTILRGNKTIGSAEVERLYENMSAATVLVEEQKGQIKEGDLVRVTS